MEKKVETHPIQPVSSNQLEISARQMVQRIDDYCINFYKSIAYMKNYIYLRNKIKSE